MSFYEEDLQVYDFGSNLDDLGALLDEGANEFNDETFGALEGDDATPVGRDFDFAGSTARLTGQDPTPPTAANATWTTKPPTQQQQQNLQPSRESSPWNSLDVDPLLSRGPPTGNRGFTMGVGTGGGAPYSTPSPFSQQQQQQHASSLESQQQPRRAARTLDEVEAEMRAQQRANLASTSSSAFVVDSAPANATGRPGGRALTLEEVEAEMLKNRSSQPQPVPLGQQQQQQQQHPSYQQQQSQSLPPPPPPPQSSSYRQSPQTQLQENQRPYPPLPPMSPAQHQQIMIMQQQQMMQQRMVPPQQQHHQQQHQQQHHHQHHQHQQTPSLPGNMMKHGPSQARVGTPGPRPGSSSSNQHPSSGGGSTAMVGSDAQILMRTAAGHNGVPIVVDKAPLSASFPNTGNGHDHLMGTLFPPLPSQGGIASVEQQLQYLSLNQHGQHPSLTSAQLQELLQQAQYHAQKEAAAAAAAAGTAGVDQNDESGEETSQAQKKATAGEQLIKDVENRIREHEQMEQKRMRKASKIASMAKHNNLMSNSDKDFITRIQVSQLVTDNPYADDFYFHIMAAIKLSRSNAAMAAGAPGAQRMTGGPNNSNGNAGGLRGPGQKKNIRRENAMNRMAQNVQRLVDSAKQRNKSGQLSLDGALGKISLRTRSAPRVLLQVSSAATTATPSTAGSALLAGLTSASKDGNSATSGTDGQPLTHRAALTIVEQVYDAVLDLEQLRRAQPALLHGIAVAKERSSVEGVEGTGTSEPTEELAAATAAMEKWDAVNATLASSLWSSLHVMDPLDACTPHPFISLISVLKGKKILPRAIRHLSQEQQLTLLTLVVASFDTLDVVVEAPLLDATDVTSKQSAGSLENKAKRSAIVVKTDAFLNAFISPVMVIIGNAPLRMVTGMVGLMLDRNNISKVVKTKPGVAFLTIFLSRAESLKQSTPAPESQDLQQWQTTFSHLFNALIGDLTALFPSTRAVSSLPFGPGYYLSGQGNSSISRTLGPDVDLEDEPVWRFLAAVAVCAGPQEQQSLVTGVREKVLENVTSASKANIATEVAALKIRNVNLLLHSLGLDASQLTIS